MLALNRADDATAPRYDTEGNLVGGLKSLPLLEQALAGPAPTENHHDEERASDSGMSSRASTVDIQSGNTSAYESPDGVDSDADGSIKFSGAFDNLSLNSSPSQSPRIGNMASATASPIASRQQPFARDESSADIGEGLSRDSQHTAASSISDASPQATSAPPLTPGQLLKVTFHKQNVIGTLLVRK